MLKRPITYEDFDGVEVTDIFYFNVSKPELIELDAKYERGFAKTLESIVESNDKDALIQKFKEIILLSYGEKSEDGKRFIKNDQVREEFTQTAAYIALYMELAMNDGAAVEFLKGILPKDMATQVPDNVTQLPQPAETSPTPPNS